MKITAFESGQASRSDVAPETRILPEESLKQKEAASGSARPKTSREEAIEVAKLALANEPDVREDIVDEMRSKIESGQYNPESSEIAEMMVRRMKADRIR